MSFEALFAFCELTVILEHHVSNSVHMGGLFWCTEQDTMCRFAGIQYLPQMASPSPVSGLIHASRSAANGCNLMPERLSACDWSRVVVL